MATLDSRLFYDRVAGVYDQRYAYSPATSTRQAAWLSQLFDPGLVLDLGCGTGRMLAPLSRAGFQTIGLDCSMAMLSRAWHKSPSRLILADARQGLPFLDDSLDLVICMHATLIHFTRPGEMKNLLAEVKRTLAPGGALVLELPHPSTFPAGPRPGAWREYQPGMSCRALGPGLEEMRLDEEGGLCTVIRVLSIEDIKRLFNDWRRVELHPGFRGGRFRPDKGEIMVVAAWV